MLFLHSYKRQHALTEHTEERSSVTKQVFTCRRSVDEEG